MTFEGDISAVKATLTPVRGRPSCKFPPCGGNGIGPAAGSTVTSDSCGAETRAASSSRSHSFSLHDGQPDRDALGSDLRMTSGLSSSDPKVVEAYWRLVDEMVFGKEGKRPALLAGVDTARGTSATNRRR